MHATIFFTVLFVPIIVRTITRRLLHDKKLTRYSRQEIAAFKSTAYPKWYKPAAIIISILMVGVPLVCFVAFMIWSFSTNHLAQLLRYIFAPDAIYFNPFPLLGVVAIFGAFLVLFALFLLMAVLTFVLPKRLQQYSQVLTKGPYVKPAGLFRQMANLTGLVYAVGLLVILACMPLYSAVNTADIAHVAHYPFIKHTSLSTVQELDATCKWDTSRITTSLAAKMTDGSSITLLAAADTTGELLPVQILPDEVRQLYLVAKSHQIPIHISVSSACHDYVLRNPQYNTAYSALF